MDGNRTGERAPRVRPGPHSPVARPTVSHRGAGAAV
jgi:hypothetical protein